jgi:O-methyltransferase
LGPSSLASLNEQARLTPDGAIVEIGVYKGGSAAILDRVAREQGRELWLFDTFTGTPFYHIGLDSNPRGSFADTSEEEIRALFPNAHVIAGVFPSSLVGTNLNKVAFVHADADQYRSTKAICEELSWLMVKGGAMLFDDYGMCDGATLAIDQAFVDLHPERCDLLETGKILVRF